MTNKDIQALSDDDIVSVLHSLGIDTNKSRYGFDVLQVSATTVPAIRNVVERCNAILATRQPAPVNRDNENQTMQQLAEFIAASAHPEDERLEVAYAIARHLKLDWPAAAPVAAAAQGDAAPTADFLPTVRDLDRISLKFGADLAQMHTDTISGVDYLQREFVMERLMQWRREWDANGKARPDPRQPSPAPVDAVPAQAGMQGDDMLDPDCHYMMTAGRICNKCGRIHRGVGGQHA